MVHSLVRWFHDLIAPAAAASPIRWREVPPEVLPWTMAIAIVSIFVVGTCISVMLVRHIRRYRIDRQGLHPAVAVGVILGVIAFWVAMYLRLVSR